MILKLTLDLPEDGAYIGLTRQVSRSILTYLQVRSDIVDDIEFIVGELASNVIRHAGQDRFQLDLEYHDDKVVLVVRDRGDGFSFDALPPPGTERVDWDRRIEAAPNQTRIGGFGLLLVRAMADHLDFQRTEPKGTTVRAEKHLAYQSSDARVHAHSLEQNDASAQVYLDGSANEARDV